MDVLIPIKNLKFVKSRLSSHLSLGERRRIVIGMLDGLVNELKKLDAINDIYIVSDDGFVIEMCRKINVSYIESNVFQGLNESIEYALSVLSKRKVSEIIILPGDLPLVNEFDVLSLVNYYLFNNNDVIVVPDNKKIGTNALVLSLPTKMKMRFGIDSFAKHVDFARSNGVKVGVFENYNISMDLDNVSDIEFIMNGGVLNDEVGLVLSEVVSREMVF
ncbi:2-phospho-L-lactate guanylyltransferase [Pseudoalteromonas sp. OOF1S-7]|uniref:2-phospho-L-lactate guanylyltransferase n=1 Tax=Pseudoalteromonas sp. OOF1S-7 TaxID=2917757 RepID=UPI001EF70677|nr:2-phospho-L-lactate guanylyltransferase [Pseudoalteromonas sp. OOF1S-7]MCG7534604.1 2-phospho-L-lactate guanylyltransferase [Pseudoalteromonas sp. OOF1S-7]